jgi:hypothetical protein
MLTFSAKDLCTRGCMQLKYLMEHPEARQQPSAAVYYGERFQKAVANTIPNIVGQEMGGCYSNGRITINFSNDIVCKDDTIVEVKSVIGNAPDWYFHSSLLQCAFYKSLILFGTNNLRTSSFYVNEGHERVYHTIDIHRKFRYILVFGEEKYEITVNRPEQIVGFFEYKGECCENWELAKNWDFRYKQLEYDKLKSFFSYKPIF